MKFNFPVLLFAALAIRLTAQIEVVSNGNVGIGTTAPMQTLTVAKAGNAGIAVHQPDAAAGSKYAQITFTHGPTFFGANDKSWQVISNGTAAGQADLAFQYWNGTNYTEWVRITSAGNVGIGTSSPAAKFQVLAGTNQSIAVYAPASASGISDFGTGGVGWSLARPNDGSLAHAIYTYNSAGNAKNNLAISGRTDIVFTAGDSGPAGAPERMRITEGGNVGIGTTSPSQKLEVNGSVKATSFISSTTTYADFVFKPDYRLPALSEVEAHIKAHGHLPGVPSEAEVAKEGIDLASMQVKLLQKVEELTLHAIAQEKEMAALRRELADLKNR